MKNWEITLAKMWDKNNHDVLIASHRGKFGSSVMENTSLAFLMAIGEGADMVEMDLDRTKDGQIVAHHDKTMERLFHKKTVIKDYTLKELKEMPLYNYTGGDNVDRLESFDEILDALKDKTILVLDRCWHCWDEVYRLLIRRNMLKQAIFKFYLEDDEAYEWAVNHPDCSFIPMSGDVNLFQRLYELKQKTQVPALEILPEHPEDPIFRKTSFDWLVNHELKVWCNSLSLARTMIFGAGYDDLKSIREGADKGWGVLVACGVDIIQTDFPHQLKSYLDTINLG